MTLNNIKKILVIRLSSLGDILLTSPVIRAIKTSYPNIQIDFLSKTVFQDVLKFNPHITNKYLLETDNYTELIEQLKQNQYEVVIDLQNNLRSRKICKKLSAAKLSFVKPTLKKFLLVHFKWNTYRSVKSIVEMYAEVVDGLKLDQHSLDFFGPDGQIISQKTKQKRIGFCPGSKHFTKMWQPEKFISLGKELASDGFEIYLIGGADDKQICNEITINIPGAINKCTENDLFQTAQNIKDCDLVVCNDSGLMHLASAIHIPLIAIFGSTVKEFGFFPYKANSFVFENPKLECRPCSHIGRAECPKKHFNCMKEIQFTDVKNKILSMI